MKPTFPDAYEFSEVAGKANELVDRAKKVHGDRLNLADFVTEYDVDPTDPLELAAYITVSNYFLLSGDAYELGGGDYKIPNPNSIYELFDEDHGFLVLPGSMMYEVFAGPIYEAYVRGGGKCGEDRYES